MQNRVTVTVAGQRYTLLAAEDPSYVERVAAYVDGKIADNKQDGTSLLDAAILAAMNLADEHFRDLETAENLRRQVKDALDDASRVKMELSNAKREIFKLQTKR